MATIDLGKIKQVWRGTWSNSPNPAYSVDDLVEYTDTGVTSTYIAVSTPGSQVPSSGGSVQSNWNLVAKGTADPIPQQSGNAGKALVTDGSAVSWGDGGAWTKIAGGVGPNPGSSAGIQLTNIFSDSYKFYKVLFSFRQDDWTRIRFIKASDNNPQSAANYTWSIWHTQINADTYNHQGSNNQTDFPGNYWNATDSGYCLTELTFFHPYASSVKTGCSIVATFNEGATFHAHHGGVVYGNAESHSGVEIWGSAGDILSSTNFNYIVLGAKV
tara:strand:- start:2049 stop:2861 length:813 start_codon:yes stop_codon:yes gene_type:complete